MYEVHSDGTVIFSVRDDTGRYTSATGPMKRTPTAKGSMFSSEALRLVFEHTTKADHPVFVVTAQNFAGKKQISVVEITDVPIASRLLSYLQNHYGTKHTNCSTLARFLYSGKLEECDPGKNAMMFDEQLTPYKGEGLAIGDVICLLRYRSPKIQTPKSDQEILREWITEDIRKRLESESISPIMLREIIKIQIVRDAHFLVVVAMQKGLPVFIEQYGRHVPGEKELRRVPIVTAVGLQRPKSEGGNMSIFWCKKR